jgi:hypothetical protein
VEVKQKLEAGIEAEQTLIQQQKEVDEGSAAATSTTAAAATEDARAADSGEVQDSLDAFMHNVTQNLEMDKVRRGDQPRPVQHCTAAVIV